jgi:hypothetical protein
MRLGGDIKSDKKIKTESIGNATVKIYNTTNHGICQ